MALSNIEQIIADIATAYETETSVAIPMPWGEKQLHVHEAPPRMVWVPRRGNVEPPGSDVGVDTQLARDTKEWVAYRWHASLVHCWGEDTGQADTLHHNLISLLAQQDWGWHGMKLGGYQWLTENEQNASWFTQGAVVVQEVAIKTYVLKALAQVVQTPIDVAHEGFLLLTGSEDGCSES